MMSEITISTVPTYILLRVVLDHVKLKSKNDYNHKLFEWETKKNAVIKERQKDFYYVEKGYESNKVDFVANDLVSKSLDQKKHQKVYLWYDVACLFISQCKFAKLLLFQSTRKWIMM